jgi:dCMP deaminase
MKEEISRGWVLESKSEVCHAEMNAIMFAAKNGVSTNHCTLVVTHSPCFECAKMIVQCGIDKVYYDEPYRDLSPVEFLKKCNVYVEEIK